MMRRTGNMNGLSIGMPGGRAVHCASELGDRDKARPAPSHQRASHQVVEVVVEMNGIESSASSMPWCQETSSLVDDDIAAVRGRIR